MYRPELGLEATARACPVCIGRNDKMTILLYIDSVENGLVDGIARLVCDSLEQE